MSTEEKDALRKLIMLISDLRAKDEERYESHVNFMNETIKMIRAIENQMNKHWSTVMDSLKRLSEDINDNLDSLLTGINPKGLRETSQSLKEIMSTMNKSVQSMNLEKVLSELKVLKAGGPIVFQQPVSAQIAEPISAGSGLTSPGAAKTSSGVSAPGTATTAPVAEGWVDPHEKKKQQDDEDQHLLKPSDFFGM